MRDGRNYVIVNTTVGKAEEAKDLACRIVAERLAACAQYMPISSVYWWKGKMESASEFLLLAKTRSSLAAKLVAFIRQHHSYELPEILVTPIQGGLGDYLSWVQSETKKAATKSRKARR